MILLSDAGSIIESIYLGDRLVSDKFKANIIVNPNKAYYNNKLIWVNSENYNLDVLAKLSQNNKIKSRIKLKDATFDYSYIPYRSDRIRNISLEICGRSDYGISRNDLSKIIIFQTSKGNLATILPKGIELGKSIGRSGMSAYELYLTLINNSLNNG